MSVAVVTAARNSPLSLPSRIAVLQVLFHCCLIDKNAIKSPRHSSVRVHSCGPCNPQRHAGPRMLSSSRFIAALRFSPRAVGVYCLLLAVSGRRSPHTQYCAFGLASAPHRRHFRTVRSSANTFGSGKGNSQCTQLCARAPLCLWHRLHVRIFSSPEHSAQLADYAICIDWIPGVTAYQVCSS